MSGAHALLASAGGGGIPVLVGQSAVVQSNSNTLVLSRPSGVQIGDLLVALMANGVHDTWTGDTGWTEQLDSGVLPGMRLATKVAGASEASSYTFTTSGGPSQSGIILAYRNAAFDLVGSVVNDNRGGSFSAPSITMTADGMLLGFFAIARPEVSFTAPSGMALLASDTDTGNPSFAVFAQESAIGATGTRSTTPSLGGSAGGVLIGIKGA